MRIFCTLVSLSTFLICGFAHEGRAQRVTLDYAQPTSFNEIITAVSEQTGYNVVMKEAFVKEQAARTVQLNNASLDQALKQLLDDRQFTYQINSDLKLVIIRERTRAENSPTDTRKNLVLAYSEIQGRVVDSLEKPLAGASIRVLNTQGEQTALQTLTDRDGEFLLRNVPEEARLEISFVGYISQRLPAQANMGTIVLRIAPSAIDDVEVIMNTGYQRIPKERATGSFVHIDNELLNRRVSSNVLERLADVTPGLIFNNGKGGAAQMRIRGQNTIHSDASVLVIVDNFPYEGDIQNINPADVESITVLKDAAASSIWGARAGNGVIVITTKKGNTSGTTSIDFTATSSLGQKPNLHYQPIISSADFIEIERANFERGFYTTYENASSKVPLSPAVELLIRQRDQPHLANEIEQEIEKLKTYDLRSDYERYLYRSPLLQQYFLSLNGTDGNHRYYASVGFDRNHSEVVGNDNRRLSTNINHQLSLFNNRLEIATQIGYNSSRQENNGLSEISALNYRRTPLNILYPYMRLADDAGNPLPIAKDYRSPYLESVADDGLLDWHYIPLEDRNLLDNTTLGHDLRLGTSLEVNILKGLSAQAQYQYWNGNSVLRNLNRVDGYYARNEINRMTQRDPVTDELLFPIPRGGILDQTHSKSYAHHLRAQLNYQITWDELHEIYALGGYEITDRQMTGITSRLYGYDERVGVSRSVNYENNYTAYFDPTITYYRVPYMDKENGSVDRFRSVFGNASYSYDRRYTLTGSLRFDESNLFGVATNQKRVPLFSVGAGWHIAQESFFSSDVVNNLSLRVTYGRSGNVNRSLTAYTTAFYSTLADATTGLIYADIWTPRNPNLRWEKITTYNLGLDFAFLHNRISGSFDYYNKNGDDIIGRMPNPGSAGIKTITGNFANTNSRGLELVLHATPLVNKVKWTNELSVSTVQDKVVQYLGSNLSAIQVMWGADGTTAYPVEGYPLWSLYSYPWLGLDPDSGDPIGILNGQPSKDYPSIITSYTMDNLIYHGPARPQWYGALQNTLAWEGLSLSFTITFRGGHYFRKETVSYYDLLNGLPSHGDYDKRWQKPGDEQHTSVPSFEDAVNSSRMQVYNMSSARVHKADHIRLQDMRLEYDLLKKVLNTNTLTKLSAFAYANHIGLLWSKSKTEYDPEYPNVTYPPIRTISFGIRAAF